MEAVKWRSVLRRLRISRPHAQKPRRGWRHLVLADSVASVGSKRRSQGLRFVTGDISIILVLIKVFAVEPLMKLDVLTIERVFF